MRRNEHGYSLIELLVVLALFGIISITITGGIHFGTRVWERAQTTAEGSDRIRGTQNFLRTLIGRVYPRRRDTSDETAEPAFRGDAARLAFLSLAPDAVGDGMVTRVALEVQTSGEGYQLSLTRQGDSGQSVPRVLLRDARHITFSFGAAQPNGEISWADTWDGSNGVPQLVRVRVAFDPKSNSAWPDLIVHPMIDRAADCIYDPVSFSCRHG